MILDKNNNREKELEKIKKNSELGEIFVNLIKKKEESKRTVVLYRYEQILLFETTKLEYKIIKKLN